MSRLLFHIGGIGVPDALRVQYALDQIESGTPYQADTHIVLTDVDHFFRVLTAARIKLMGYIHTRGSAPSVRALAQGLHRSYANVHSDVVALGKAGLIERRGNELMVTWDGKDDPEAECGSPTWWSDAQAAGT